ncbi:MFS transporter [Paramicrobacterium chengjingii]|uniref:MFS transporter n=1 Tax=Paramicrobacterium chengjingii TaxID=2769067 RepID=A0ABX6YMM9_9MICO|nr:MFS transporter [Microbacterium chengjingii]QPZ40049.1 MFS transporter [Microbacterium chengjingii]
MNSRRSWMVFVVGVSAYVVAILQRSTLGVSGVAAVERFDITAAALSSLAVVQLVVYAAMQIPIGLLIDRWGPRRLLIIGLILISIGQAVLAIAPDLSIAALGRVCVGIGDAGIFVSVLRLVNYWFSGPIVPSLSQWTGNIGQFGQVLSALPFALLLNTIGWESAYLAAAALCVLMLIGVLICISDRPVDDSTGPIRRTWGSSLDILVDSLKRPGTRLGFWAHFTTQSSGTVFSLLWGFPFMVYALGISESAAAGLLLVIVFSGVVFGPILGILTARFPLRRSNLVLTIVSTMGIAWTMFLAWPGHPPMWVLIVLLVALGIGGPGSLIGFDFARTFNHSRALGSANGIVNVGGFLASFTMMFVIGFVLDLLSPGATTPEQTYSLSSFKIAFLVQYVVIGFGVVMLFLARRTTRTRLAEDEGIKVAPLWVALVRRERRDGD